jgi:hypothetical protein
VRAAPLLAVQWTEEREQMTKCTNTLFSQMQMNDKCSWCYLHEFASDFSFKKLNVIYKFKINLSRFLRNNVLSSFQGLMGVLDK